MRYDSFILRRTVRGTRPPLVGITTIVGKLNDANPLLRAGASSTLQKIYQKYNEAADLDRSIDAIKQAIRTVVPEQAIFLFPANNESTIL